MKSFWTFRLFESTRYVDRMNYDDMKKRVSAIYSQPGGRNAIISDGNPVLDSPIPLPAGLFLLHTPG